MATTDDRIDKLTTAIETLVKGNKTAPQPSSNFSSSIPGVSAITSATDQLAKLASGTATTADLTGKFSEVLTKIPGAGALAGDAFKKIADQVYEANNAMRETSKVGVTFGGDLGEYNLAVKSAHLTLGEFSDMVSRGSESLASLSGGMDRSARTLLTVAKDVQSSDIGQDLKAAGMSAQQLAEITQASLKSQVGLNINDRASREKATGAAVDLALQLQLNADITGKSVKSQLDAMDPMKQSLEVQASVMAAGPKLQEEINTASSVLTDMGDDVSNLVKEAMTGGIRTEAGQKFSQAVDPASLAILKQMEVSGKAGNTELTKQLSMQFRASLIETNKSRLERSAAIGSREIEAYQQFQRATNAATANSIGAARTIPGMEGASAYDIQLKQQAEAKASIQGKKPEDGTKNLDAAVSRGVNQADNLAKVLGVGLAQGASTANTKLGEMSKTIALTDQELKKMGTWSGLKDKTGDALKDLSEGATNTLKEVGNTFGARGEAKEVKVPQRENGTLGTTGKLWEEGIPPTGQIMNIHPNETIIPKAGMGEFLSKLDPAQFGALKRAPNETIIPKAGMGEFLSKLDPAQFGALKRAPTDNIQSMIEKADERVGVRHKSNNLEQLTSSQNKQQIDIADKKKTIVDLEAKQRQLSNSMYGKDGKMVDNVKFINDTNDAIQEIISKKYDIKKELATKNQKAPTLLATAKLAHPTGIQAHANHDKVSINQLLSKHAHEATEKRNQLAKPPVEHVALPAEKVQPVATTPHESITPVMEQLLSPSASMTDIKDELVQLNSSIRELISHTDKVVDGIGKQVRATKQNSTSRI